MQNVLDFDKQFNNIISRRKIVNSKMIILIYNI